MDTPATSPQPRRRSRKGRIALAIVLVLIAAIGGVVWYGLSESGLPFIVARVVAQSGGRLEVEGPSGSVAGTMRFRRLVWHGTDTTVEADDVVVEWHPGALWHSELAIDGLGAARVAIAIKPSAGATSPPTNLALPLTVSLARVAVSELVFRAGPRTNAITGLAFSYRGDAARHVVDNLRLASEYGALSGAATLGAQAPLPLNGKLAIAGDGPLAGARLDVTLDGALARLAVAAKGALRGADLDAHASVTPFATSPFERVDATLRGLDAAAFDAGLPHTALGLTASVLPAPDGFTGTADVTNDVPGALDAGKLPFAAASARYHWHPAALEFESLDVRLPGNGRATGQGRVPLGTPRLPSQWTLALTDVDPALLHTRLVHTRVRGEIAATVEGARQTVSGTLGDGRNDVTFAATIADERVDVSRARLRAGTGSIDGSGSLALTGNRALAAHLTMTRFDPARFVAGANGTLDATLDVRGALQPAWQARVEAEVASGSRYAGVPVSGQARGTLTRGRAQDVTVDAHAGGAAVKLNGNAGAVGDRLAFVVDTARLGDLAPILPATLLPASGTLHAEGALRVEPGGVGGEAHVRAAALHVAELARAATLELDATLAPGGAGAHPTAPSERAFDVRGTSTGLVTEGRRLDQASVRIAGTLARHDVTVSGTSEGLSVQAQASGGLAPGRELAASTWSGRVTALDTRGTLALHLRAPATVTLARTHVHIGDAHVDVADGRADVEELAIAEGRVDTRGSFTGVPLTSLLAIAGQPAPLASTLVLGGEWSIAATPRLHGTFAVRRERGELYGTDAGPNPTLAFGLTALEVSGTLADDALRARGTLRSTRAGNADAQVSIGSVAGAAQGKLAASAPLSATLDAELASLAPLQPLLGTQAVVAGRLRAHVRADGTLGAPVLAGNVQGDDLRVDAPQYGVHLADGRVRATLADGRVTLETLSFAGGDGRFTAHGTLAAAGRPDAAHVEWTAERLRVTDRPDLRLVVEGQGTLAFADKRVTVAGALKIVDGHIEYQPSPPGRLGADVVVKGWPVQERRGAGFRDVPLALDLDVDLGRLTFVGEGLDAVLAGRVKVTTGPTGALRGRGTIRTVYGTYYAFGQKLTIDRGRVIFDGPLEDPALDVVALRKNLAVEAGVELTGTVKVPRVQITSNPPVPENEALSWLITGQGLSGGGRADYAALGAASAALLGRGGKPITTQIAQQLGLDDISVQSSGTATGTSTNPVAGQVVVFGKRISDRLTLGYEQGLSLASGALRLEYALSRTLTVRAEAGTISSLGLYYRRLFE